MKVLLIGASGQLGRFLDRLLEVERYDYHSLTKLDFDLNNYTEISAKLSVFKPNVIINAAAFTSVDLAETEQEAANNVNFKAVKELANLSSLLGCFLIHVSTDYVFDGKSPLPYPENSIPNPQSIYGVSKLAGENAIRGSNCNFIIIRTSWLFSEYGSNFLKTMVNLFEKKQEVSVVNDQYGRPTYAKDLANAIMRCLKMIDLQSEINEIYHYAGFQTCTWFEFAKYIYEQLKKFDLKLQCKINPISTDQFPAIAKRPVYSSLDSNLFCEKFRIGPSDWKKGVENTLLELWNQNSR